MAIIPIISHSILYWLCVRLVAVGIRTWKIVIVYDNCWCQNTRCFSITGVFVSRRPFLSVYVPHAFIWSQHVFVFLVSIWSQHILKLSDLMHLLYSNVRSLGLTFAIYSLTLWSVAMWHRLEILESLCVSGLRVCKPLARVLNRIFRHLSVSFSTQSAHNWKFNNLWSHRRNIRSDIRLSFVMQ